MTSIQDFFAAQAAAFSRNELEGIAKGFQTPTRIIVGNATLFLADTATAIDAAQTYRDNLETEGYHHSEVDVLHLEEAENGCVRILAHWRELNAQGAIIAQLEGSYFCRFDQSEGWKVTLMEVLAPPPARLLSGIALR